VLGQLHLERVGDPADPRLKPFLALPLRKSVGAAPDEWFIAEGRLVVERLLASPYEPVALLVTESKQRWVETVCAAAVSVRELPGPLPVYLLPDDRMPEVVGFDFHSGILGAGRRQTPSVWTTEFARWFHRVPSPATACVKSLDETDSREMDSSGRGSLGLDFSGVDPHGALSSEFAPRATETLLILPAMSLAENLGSILRSARGLGATGAVLAAQSADPLSRRVIRVSMGHALSFPCWHSPDWRRDLLRLREAGFRLIGIEHHPRMCPLHQAPRYPRQALVMGNEFAGLDDVTLEMMDDVVGIPMHPAVDSLNVAVTAALALHHYASG
jgi:tRNA G18 (ribose-2'-O)-methylase SpoU